VFTEEFSAKQLAFYKETEEKMLDIFGPEGAHAQFLDQLMVLLFGADNKSSTDFKARFHIKTVEEALLIKSYFVRHYLQILSSVYLSRIFQSEVNYISDLTDQAYDLDIEKLNLEKKRSALNEDTRQAIMSADYNNLTRLINEVTNRLDINKRSRESLNSSRGAAEALVKKVSGPLDALQGQIKRSQRYYDASDSPASMLKNNVADTIGSNIASVSTHILTSNAKQVSKMG
jgi:hypothetical protein